LQQSGCIIAHHLRRLRVTAIPVTRPRALASLLAAAGLSIAGLFTGHSAWAEAPQLYRQAAFQSPVRGDPDDLLMLAGYGLAAGDQVVYRAVPSTGESIVHPDRVPQSCDAWQGVAPLVSADNVPYALTIRLPREMQAGETYALWVHTPQGEWSRALKINDARPLWFSPAYVYSSDMPGFLPRELKIVGRNLQRDGGAATRIRLTGPQQFIGSAILDSPSSPTLNEFVARVALPARLDPGRYRIQLSRANAAWVDVPEQSLEVLPDPPPAAEFSMVDPRFGGCRPDDGTDDTACILRAIAAAVRAGGGIINFPPGTWDLIDHQQPGVMGGEGILVPPGVALRGAGSGRTKLQRHPEWNAGGVAAAVTLVGPTLVTGFTFHDLQVYEPEDRSRPFLQLGEDWQRVASAAGDSATAAAVRDVVITRNVFDKPMVAIGSGGLPIDRLLITYNTFGAYGTALELTGDQFNVFHKFRLADSVIDHNLFEPGSKLDLIRKTGTGASELAAGRRVDFSGNTADGASTEYLYSPDDARGWRAAFFWSPSDNVEQVLVSQNTATCTGDKIGDGEAISFDNNTNTFAFSAASPVARAGATTVTVSLPLAARQHDRDVPVASYYIGHWVQVVSGPGLGQARKITGYSTDPASHATTFEAAPAWDVVPIAGQSRVTIGREYWQLYVLDNQIDNRRPLCQKSNRSRSAAGSIMLWAQSADSVIAGNRQYDSDGIFVQQVYITPEHPCADCTMQSFLHAFLDIRANLIDGEYEWMTDCSRSGIVIGIGAAPWGDAPPPTVGFGVSISHNTIRHADAQDGGAISQLGSWFAGPKPHRWPLSDNLLIHHNAIIDIDGARALPVCGSSRRPRTGIAFPDSAIAWRTVLYANSCRHVSVPVGEGGVDVVKVCPSPPSDSCECAGAPAP
jgi:hypothetical protein